MNLKLAPGCRYFGGVDHNIALDPIRQLMERADVYPTESATLRPYDRRLHRPALFHIAVSRKDARSEAVCIVLQLGGGIERFRYEVAIQTHKKGLEESIRDLKWEAAVMVAEGFGPYVSEPYQKVFQTPEIEAPKVIRVPLPRKTLPTNHPLRHAAFIPRFLRRFMPACVMEYGGLLTAFLHRFPQSDEDEFNKALDHLCVYDRVYDHTVSGTEYVELRNGPEGQIPCVTGTEALVAIEISHRVLRNGSYVKAGTRELYRELRQYDPTLRLEEVSRSLDNLVEREVLSQYKLVHYALNVHSLYVLSAHPNGCHTVSV